MADSTEDTVNILLYSDIRFSSQCYERGWHPPGRACRRSTGQRNRSWRGHEVQADDFDLLILDGETQKVGAMALLRRLDVEFDNVPPSITVIARQQDSWILLLWHNQDPGYPLDPIELQETVTELLSSVQTFRLYAPA